MAATLFAAAVQYDSRMCASEGEITEEKREQSVETGVIRYMFEDDGENQKTRHSVGGGSFVYQLYVPLAYAVAFPLVRTLGRGRLPPKTITNIQMGLVSFALGHAAYIMFGDSSV